jgi:hypothetical protein
MKTKALIFGAIILLIQACSTGEKEESFYEFMKKFESDSVFQAARVRFPFQQITWADEGDEETTLEIKKEGWSFLDLKEEEEAAHREFDKYTRELVVFEDSAKVCFRGIDNGIYVDFDFYSFDGQWFLVSSNDYSN